MKEVKFSINELTLTYEWEKWTEVIQLEWETKMYTYKQMMDIIKDKIEEVINEKVKLKLTN